jgi:hypothetical protein
MKDTLKDRLSEWTDWDGAAYCLGLMPDGDAFGGAKHVFWSNDPIGNMLHSMLELLVEQRALEKRDEPDIQYRWSPSFVGS